MDFRQWETKEDLSNEQDVARLIEKKWNCHTHKLPKHYRADFELARGGETIGFAEVKCRAIPHNRYRTLILSLAKVAMTRLYAQTAGVPIYLVVRFTDGVFYTDLSAFQSFKTTHGGRTNRTRDSRDLEPVCNIPTSALIKL